MLKPTQQGGRVSTWRLGAKAGPQLSSSPNMATQPPITTTEAECAAAEQLSSLLTERGPLELHAVVVELPAIKDFLHEASLRLVPFCQLFPDRFVLEPLASFTQLRLRLRAEGEVQMEASLAAAATAAVEARFVEKLHQYHQQRPSTELDAVPLAWLQRSAGSAVELLVATAGEPSLLFHLWPQAHGYPNRLQAWWGCLSAHMQRFTASRPQTLAWHGGEPCTLHHSRCWCRAGVSLTAASARTVSARAPPANQPKPSKAAKLAAQHQRRHGGADDGADGAPSWQPLEESLPVRALLAACEGGGDVLTLRAPQRTAALFATELAAAAQYARLPTPLLQPIGPGLWLLRPADAAEGAGAATAREQLMRLLPRLGAVRGSGTLLAATAGPSALLRLLHSPRWAEALRRRVFGDGSGAGAWSLRCEQTFPSADHRCLPFHSVAQLPALCIGLHAALGGTFVGPSSCTGDADGDDDDGLVGGLVGADEPEAEAARAAVACNGVGGGGAGAEGGAGPCVRLLLLQTKTAVMLLCEGGDKDAALGGDGAGGAGGAGAGAEGVALRLPAWVGAWERRGFAFSSALDPLVAIAAVNIALLAHMHRRRAGGDGSHEQDGKAEEEEEEPHLALRRLTLYDPCCGSGTVLAAAAAMGCARLRGSDLRSDFAEQAETNLTAAGALGGEAQLFAHDATRPLPPPGVRADLVVSNPPWGKNCGQAADGVAIVRSMTAQCPGATFCWIANGLAVQALREMEGVRVLWHGIPFGGVELVVVVNEAHSP